MRKKTDRLRAVLVCALALVLLGFSLLSQIRLSEARRELEALEREKADLLCERRILTVRLAGRLPLEELDRLAAERLGMQRARADQSVTIEIP